MPISFFQSLFRSRLGRRTLGLFIFGALMPTAALAWIFHHQAGEHLLVQTSSRLQQESTSHGMMLYSHLLTLTADLDRMAAALPQDGPVTDTTVPPVPRNEFQEIRILPFEPAQGGLTPPQIAHLQEGKSLLEIHAVSGHQPQLTLIRLINPRRLEAGLLSAQLTETALWDGQVQESLPADTDLVVQDGTGQPLYSTFDPAITLQDFRRQDSGAPVGTILKWNIGGQDYVAGAWSMPLQQLFLTDPWVVVISQTRRSVLSPLEQFRHTVLFILAFGLCTALMSSISLIRRSLHPVLQLNEGIARLDSGRFSTRVTVHNHDEFEELADSFNEMTESVSRRLRMAENLSSIGQALLSIREPADLAGIVLPRLSTTIECDATGLVLLDPDDTDPTILSMQSLGEQSDALMTSRCHVTDEHRETLHAHPDHTVVTSATLPSFLTAMQRTDLSLFALLPIIISDGIGGVLVLGYRQKKRPPADDLSHARRVADLIALTVLNSRAMSTHVQARLDVGPAVEATQATEEQSTPLPRPETTDASQATVEFLTAMSHEIRTPLNGVIGMTEILAHTPLTATQRQYVDTIHDCAAVLLGRISNRVDCSEIETGTLELRPDLIDLRDLIEDIVEQSAEPAQRKGLQIQTFYDPSIPTAVLGDPLRIRQIVTNLVSNAVTFTQTGEVTVSVTAELDEAGRTDMLNIKLAVADTGPGISIERQGDLFRSISLLDTSPARIPGGTGLGLPLCKQLTELMGGVIGVESAIGKGSTFWVSLPLPLQSATPTLIQPESTFENLCLCTAIGTASTRRVLTQYLAAWGVAPHIAESEGEFLEHIMTGLATERGPVVAVIDETFDNMTNIEIVRTLFSEPTLQTVKIIRLISLIRMAVTEQNLPSLYTHDVSKPIRFRALKQALVSALADEPSMAQHPTSAPVTPMLSGHILLGEDNLVNQEVTLLMLQSMGYRVTVAPTGREVVDHAKESGCDAILMDCQMPEMDGFEATTQIRELEERESRAPVPIIALTAHASPDDRERCRSVGMNDYVSKPFTMTQLQAVLTFWLALNPTTQGHDTPASSQPGPTTSLPTTSASVLDPDTSCSVDRNTWKSITQLQRPGEPDALAKILSLFVADSRTLVTTLRQGMADGNTQVVNQAAHSLRSRSATLGAVSLSKLCRQFEELSRQGRLTEAESLLVPLADAFDHASRIFQEELERRST